jgi:hypothetical protein
VDTLWAALVAHVEGKAEYFRLFDRHRLRPDPWLKVEALSVVSGARRAGGVRDVRPDRQGCDVWFSTPEGEHWLAARGLITSYAGGGRDARPTIASVEEVAREMDKLGGLATLSGGSAALLLAAFPFGPEPRERSEWAAQLLRFEIKGFTVAESRTLPLGPEREARLYLFR